MTYEHSSAHRVAGAIAAFFISAGVAVGHTPHTSGLPHNIPDFCATPTIISTASGVWSDTSTWTPSRVPVAGDLVSIAAGTVVTYNVVSDAALVCVGIKGQLAFRTDISTRLKVGTLLVMEGGHLRVGSDATPIAAAVTAEIVIANQALDLVTDPEQYGTGLIVLGKLTMHGAVKSPTFVRVTREPLAGDATLDLENATNGWRPGDNLILPDSRHLKDVERGLAYVPQREELTAAAAGAASVTLAGTLAFNHKGARDGDGTLSFLPHVGNLTRNAIVRSEAAIGTRGHVMFVGRADVDVRYALFKDLGRTTIDPLVATVLDATGHPLSTGTNQPGRYALHMHHLIGPSIVPANGYQFTVVGNVVRGATRWGITIHGSHYGVIRENIVYDVKGAGVVTQDGSESFNVIERNFVVRCEGTAGWAIARGATTPPDFGYEGSSFWFRGPHNYVRDNVAANATEYGYSYVMWYGGLVKIPAYKGGDPSAAGQAADMDVTGTPLLEFARNEIYGAITSGLTIWWLGTYGDDPKPVAESVIKDFRAWHFHVYGYFGYPANRTTFDGVVVRGDREVLTNPYEFPTGLWFGDYMSKSVVVKNANIQGMKIGIIAPYFADARNTSGADAGLTVIENSYLRNYINIEIGTMWTVNGAGGLPPKKTVIRNCRFATVTMAPLPYPPSAISMAYRLRPGAHLVQRDQVFVYDYDQVPGDNFQVFYTEQRSETVVHQTGVTPNGGHIAIGSPDAGLTNQQNWTKHSIAIAGAVSPCSTTRSGIAGFVCPLVSTTPAPAPAPVPAPVPTPAPTSAPVLPTYYLAEGATGGFFELEICLANPNASSAPITVTFMKSDGSTVVRTHELPAHSRRTIRVNDVEGLGDTPVSTVVESTGGLPLAVERTMLWSRDHHGGHGGSAVDRPDTRWYFAEASQGFFDTYLLLANANTAAATVTVTFLRESGAPVVRTYSVAPTSRFNVFAGEIPDLGDSSFSMVVDSTLPIIAERAMYFGASWAGGHESAGVPAPATSWFHAEGATGEYFDTYILVANPNATDATVTFTYLLPSGSTVTKVHRMRPNSRLTVNVETEDSRLANTAVSTTVTADVPVVSERAMYWPGPFTTWMEAHNSFGLSQTGTRWALAEGRVGGTQGFETFLLLANPGPTEGADVRVTFLRQGAPPVTKNYTVGPNSRFNVYANGVAELQDEHFGALVESINGVPIVVERAMYWNTPGQTWAGGTNATAVRVP